MTCAIQKLFGVGKKATHLYSTRTLDVESNEYRITIFWGGQAFASYLEESERPLRNNVIAVLAKGGIRQVDLARVFGIKPPQVNRYVKAFEKGGSQPIHYARAGRPGIIDDRIVAFVQRRYREIRAQGRSQWRGEVEEEVLEKFGIAVCKTLLSKIVRPLIGESKGGLEEEKNLERWSKASRPSVAEGPAQERTERTRCPGLFDDSENGAGACAGQDESVDGGDERRDVEGTKWVGAEFGTESLAKDGRLSGGGEAEAERFERGNGRSDGEAVVGNELSQSATSASLLEEATASNGVEGVSGEKRALRGEGPLLATGSEAGSSEGKRREETLPRRRSENGESPDGERRSQTDGTIVRVSYSTPTGSEAKLLSRLEEGLHSRYAGGLLLNPFIARMLSGVLDVERSVRNNTRYGFESFMVLFVQMGQFGFVNMESVRSIQTDEFGPLAQVDRSASIDNFRCLAGELLEKVELQKMEVRLARNYLEHLSVGSRVFYIDGHFQSYTGKAKILWDYNNRTKRTEKGNQQYVLGDGRGNPLLLLLSDSMLKLNEVLPVMVRQLSGLLSGGIRPLLVFDRGVSDREVIGRLPTELDTDYLAWEVGDETDYTEMELDYEPVRVELQGNTPDKPKHRTFQVAEAPRELQVGIWSEGSPLQHHRRLILREECKRRGETLTYCYPFIASDLETPKTELVAPLVYRWREEVGFKMLTQDYGFDEITTYETIPYSPEMINAFPEELAEHVQEKESRNPDRQRCLARRREVNRRLLEVEARLAEVRGERPTRPSAARSNLPRDPKKLCELKSKYERDLDELEAQLAVLPTRVVRFSRCCETGIVRWDFQKKTFLDLLRIAAHNIRRMALDEWMGVYTNWRDYTERFRDLLNVGGTLKLKGDHLTVELKQLPAPRYQRAAEAFVNRVHLAQPRTFGVAKLPIRFRFKK